MNFNFPEGGHQSPATEDEAVSEFEADSVPSKQEYSLPQARCKIFYTKVIVDLLKHNKPGPSKHASRPGGSQPAYPYNFFCSPGNNFTKPPIS